MKVNQLKAGVVLSYLSMAVSNLISLLYTPIMLRTIGQNEYGLYTLCASTISYLGLMTFGFGSSYVKFYTEYKVKDERDEIARLNGMFVAIYGVIALLTLVVGTVLVFNIENIFERSLSSNEIYKSRIIMSLMIVSMIINLSTATFSSYVTAHERYIFQKVLGLLNTVLNPMLMFPLLMLGYKTIAMSIVSLLCSVVHAIINIYYCKHKLKFEVSFRWTSIKKFKELFTFSFFIFLNMIMIKLIECR